jgi:hypothetical protein
MSDIPLMCPIPDLALHMNGEMAFRRSGVGRSEISFPGRSRSAPLRFVDRPKSPCNDVSTYDALCPAEVRPCPEVQTT